MAVTGSSQTQDRNIGNDWQTCKRRAASLRANWIVLPSKATRSNKVHYEDGVILEIKEL